MPVGFNSTTNAKDIAANQRAMVQQQGDVLNQENLDQFNQQQQQAGGYQNWLWPYLEQMVQQGGYTPDEAAQIMGAQGQNGVPGLSDIYSPTNLASNYLTPDEQAAIAGNPNYSGYFDPAAMDAAQQQSAAAQRWAVQNLQQGVQGAIDPTKLAQSQDYLNKAGATTANTRNTTMGALYGEAGNVRGAIDPTQLRQSAEAAQAEKMTPQEQQDIVTGAGISAGVGNAAAIGDLMRQTAAAGGSPDAVAAYRDRMSRQSAAEAGDAMTQARIAASNAAAQRAQTAEQQRLTAEQYLTGAKTGSELQMGQQAVQAEQGLGAQELAQLNQQEQQREAAQQYLTGAGMQAATIGGEANIGGEQAINAQQRQQQQFNTQAGTGILQAQDQAAAQRAAQIAQNRQGVNQANQQAQLTANQLASQRGAQVANTRLAQQQAGMAGVTGQETQANQNAQNALNRQTQVYGTQTSGTNQAANTGVQASQIPGTFEKIVGGVTGAVGAAGGVPGISKGIGALSKISDGEVVTKPTLAIIGEDYMPEAVIPLSSKQNAKVRPSVAFGQERMRRFYGEAA